MTTHRTEQGENADVVEGVDEAVDATEAPSGRVDDAEPQRTGRANTHTHTYRDNSP